MNMIQKAVTDALDSLDIDYEITEHPLFIPLTK